MQISHLSLFSLSVVSKSLRSHALQHARLPCPSPSPRACSNSCPLSWWCHDHLVLFVPFSSCLQSSPVPGSLSTINDICMKVKVLVTQSCPTLCNPWTVAHQAPLSMGFSRQEHWRGQPFPSSRDLPDPGIKPKSLPLQVDSLLPEPQGKPYIYTYVCVCVCVCVCVISHNCTYKPSLLSPTPFSNLTPLGHHRAPDWTSCVTQSHLLAGIHFTNDLYRMK